MRYNSGVDTWMKNAQVIYAIEKPDTHFDNLYVSRAHI